ncbi:unnamed protein product [Prunus armeniaca]
MASTDLPPIMLDHLYSMDDNLKAGGPLLLLEDARENPVVGDEPSPETAHGEFTPTLEDVANISRLPIYGDRSPFNVALTPAERDKLAVLQRGAPTSPSTSLRFSNWIQHFGLPARACISLGFGHSPRRHHPLSPHVFLWERLKGLDVHSLPHSHAMKLADWGNGSFMPDKLPLVCRWFKRMQRKGHNFLKLLDNIENFVFRPYGTSAETFTFVPFYADVSDTVAVPAAVSQSGRFRKYALLNVAPIPLPILGDNRAEISVTYSPHRVRQQFGLDQGVPSSPNHGDPFALHRIFWSNDHIPASCRLIVLASKARIGGFSRGYQAYWNRCLTSFREFQSSPGDRLPHTTARLVGLVSEKKAIPLSKSAICHLFPSQVMLSENFPRQVQSPGRRVPIALEKL